MKELSLHLLDIAQNSVAAGATTVRIRVEEDSSKDRLDMVVTDNGKGMDAETVAKVTNPFYTTRTTRKVGLGIPLLKEAAEACNGMLEIQSEPGKGATLRVSFQRSHIDRMPLGDLSGTFLTLLIGEPEINWIFEYQVNSEVFQFDSAPIIQELGGVPLTDPTILSFLRELLETGVRNTQLVSVQ
ncbi:MAG TPA: ATP-binding protein [Longilinea sp.]|nr:ATP-binding protein [Longilinea sp.]